MRKTYAERVDGAEKPKDASRLPGPGLGTARGGRLELVRVRSCVLKSETRGRPTNGATSMALNSAGIMSILMSAGDDEK